MIVDTLAQAHSYRGLGARFDAAFRYLATLGEPWPAPGRLAVSGSDVYAILQDEPGRPREKARLEAHRTYADIQYVVEGVDEMGWSPLSACRFQGPYDAAKDVLIAEDPPAAWVPVSAGWFAVFFPWDAHAPMISAGRLKKVVVKVRMEGA